ncbi:hypothetical protein C9374_000818 [Naegleria lovaniensis]|uniref:Uncharacterized protein n=1 Tax=Naegleria lovaniensis TaxID=51637 RepID=A0AA88KMV5_NAELO|nr:uncharacterized protein C9374_000818 [Naegleria lovaniensis]KAG2387968.1 hypothetical protein C9374_000818 [Naegleria lovaniensis]
MTRLIVATTLLLALLAFASFTQAIDYSKVLKNYVQSPESIFSYSLLATIPTPVATVYVLNITSLSWLTPAEVGIRNTYFHYATVAVPATLDRTKTQAALYITGGSNTQSPPGPDPVITPFAFASQSVGVTLYDIPNQPMTYASDPTQAIRSEDAIIAFGWARFLNDTTQTPYVTQLPMVKASKLAMDAVVDFVKKTINYEIETFTVIGGSKRGWTTLLLAGVDNRVKSIIPAVIPVFEIKKVFESVYNNLCAWPVVMKDYVLANVVDMLYTPAFNKLSKIIDPSNYSRLGSIQKFQVFALGDEFFAPNLNSIGYDEIEGENYVRYIPNTGHALSNSDVFQVILSYQVARLNNMVLPKYKFSHEHVEEGVIIKLKVTNGKLPTRVNVWTATNPNARDFRTYVIGANVWNSTVIQETKPFHWQVLIRNPPKGYTAATVELVYENYVTSSVPGVAMAPLKFTTNAYVTPDTTPCNIGPENPPTHNMS